MSPTTNPVTLSLKVMVMGIGEMLVGSGAADVISTVGATLSNINPARVAVPPEVVTDTIPELPPPTTAEIWVALTTENEAAGVPPKSTAVAVVKLVPVITMVLPLVAVVGVNEEMVGAGMKVNPASEATPPGVVTETFPDVPLATTAVMVVALITLKDAAFVPPKLTAVAPVKLEPEIVTVAPEPALVGVNELMVGGGITVKLPLETMVTPFAVTLIGPVVAPAGTVVLILVPPPITEIGEAVILLKNLTEVT
jgi:hypothetical protein